MLCLRLEDNDDDRRSSTLSDGEGMSSRLFPMLHTLIDICGRVAQTIHHCGVANLL